MYATDNGYTFSAKDEASLGDTLETKDNLDPFEICRIELLQHVILKVTSWKDVARKLPCCPNLWLYIVYIAKERYNESEETTGFYSFGKDLITRKESDAYECARKGYPRERKIT